MNIGKALLPCGGEAAQGSVEMFDEVSMELLPLCLPEAPALSFLYSGELYIISKVKTSQEIEDVGAVLSVPKSSPRLLPSSRTL